MRFTHAMSVPYCIHSVMGGGAVEASQPAAVGIERSGQIGIQRFDRQLLGQIQRKSNMGRGQGHRLTTNPI